MAARQSAAMTTSASVATCGCAAELLRPSLHRQRCMRGRSVASRASSEVLHDRRVPATRPDAMSAYAGARAMSHGRRRDVAGGADESCRPRLERAWARRSSSRCCGRCTGTRARVRTARSRRSKRTSAWRSRGQLSPTNSVCACSKPTGAPAGSRPSSRYGLRAPAAVRPAPAHHDQLPSRAVRSTSSRAASPAVRRACLRRRRRVARALAGRPKRRPSVSSPAVLSRGAGAPRPGHGHAFSL